MNTSNPDRTPPLLTVNEVASLLRVTKMSVYQLVQAGELPHEKIGGSFRIPAGAVARLKLAADVAVLPALADCQDRRPARCLTAGGNGSSRRRPREQD